MTAGLTFTPYHHSLAELVIPPHTGEFGVVTSNGSDLKQNHEIGIYGSPRWQLSISLDDDWNLNTLPTGKLLQAITGTPQPLDTPHTPHPPGEPPSADSQAPHALDTPSTPDTPDTPDTPSELLSAVRPTPQALDTPHTPGTPRELLSADGPTPQALDTPHTPGTPRELLSADGPTPQALGTPDAPESLETPETLGTERSLSAGGNASEGLEWEYMTWAEGSRAEDGFGVLCALPAGRYFVVRSELSPQRAAQVRLGNERLQPPDNVLSILDQPPRSAAAIGAHPDGPPNLAQPLVGLAILNSTGSSNTPTLLFFAPTDRSAAGVRRYSASGSAPRKQQSGDVNLPQTPVSQLTQHPPVPEHRAAAVSQPVGDLVLVVPVTGELVIDTMTRFTGESPTEDQRTWSKTDAEKFAVLLKGSPPTRTIKVGR
ncbi:hypothetical protein [Kribbella sp. NPDC055071]